MRDDFESVLGIGASWRRMFAVSANFSHTTSVNTAITKAQKNKILPRYKLLTPGHSTGLSTGSPDKVDFNE